MPLVTVAGRFELPDDTPAAAGTMTWWLTPSDVPDTVEPVTVLAGPVAAPIDETGAFTVDLRATDDPALTEHVDGALIYRVRRTGTLGYGEWDVTVPGPGPWDWTELSPAPNGHGTVTPVPGPVGPQGPTGADSTVPGPVGPTGPQGPAVALATNAETIAGTDATKAVTPAGGAATYVPMLDAVPAVGTTLTSFEVNDSTQTNSQWRSVYGTALFQTNKADPLAFFGWNADKALGGGDAAEPAVYMGFEADYWDTPTKRTMEWYVGVLRADGSGPQFRPFAFIAARDSNSDLAASVQIDIGSNANGSTRSVFNVIAGGPSIFTVTPTGVGMSKPLTLTGTSSNLQVQNGSITLNSSSTASAGHVYLNNSGAVRWYIANFHGDASFYIWDAVNGRFQVKTAGGASNTAALTTFQSSVQIHGNVGFYGTTPVAKPTGVAVTVVGIHAALVTLGLIAA